MCLRHCVSSLKSVFRSFLHRLQHAPHQIRVNLVSSFLLEIIILTSANLIFITYWSVYVVNRYTSLNAFVYDMGIGFEEGWLVFHTHWNLQLFYHDFGRYSGAFLLSPLTLSGNALVVLVTQVVFLSFGSFLIYFASKTKIAHSSLAPLFLAISYLLYFPLTMLHFDFHFEVFFVPFFLACYWAYVSKRHKLCVILLIIGGLFRFPYLAFSGGFIVLNLISDTKIFQKYGAPKLGKQDITLYIIGLVIIWLLLFFQYFSVISSGTLESYTAAGSISLNNIHYNLDSKIYTILLIFSPFLFLPMHSKHSILLLPIILLILFTVSAYRFPGLFEDQYSAAIIPFVFVASIESLASLKISPHSNEKQYQKVISDQNQREGSNGKTRLLIEPAGKSATMVLITVILFSLVFQPYGPLNQYSSDNLHVSDANSPNMTIYNDMIQITRLIPNNVSSSQILVEDTIPYIFPRPNSYGLDANNPLSYPLEIDYNYNFYYNYTEYGGKLGYLQIDPLYIIMDPLVPSAGNSTYWNYVNNVGPYPHNISNYGLIQHLRSVFHYGILAEAGGIFLLERDYYGLVKFYAPLELKYSAVYFNPDSHVVVANSSYSLINPIRENFVYGPRALLYPGTYNLTFFFQSTSKPVNGSMNIRVTYNYSTVLAEKNLTDYDFVHGDKYIEASMHFTATDFYEEVQFPINTVTWNGTILFCGATLTQIGVP